MPDRLLVRHFLLRFLDHDLISPHADRREVLTITCAMVVVSSLFLSFFLAVKYQFNLFLPPGLTSILALDDRFFLISLSMIVMALLAVAEWEALALDARDAAVLGPLPVPTAAIVRAKFTAIAMFAVAFDVGLSLGPTTLRVVALPVRLPITMAGALRLTAAHAVCALAAGAFGFTAILGVRELCRAVLGAAIFRRLSAALQASLVVLLLTALLLLPGGYARVALRWMTHTHVSAVMVPPLWFVGLHETLAGSVIDGLPRGAPPRRFAIAERDATALYRSLWPQFNQLGRVAVAGFLMVLLVTMAACAWNHRRLPSEMERHVQATTFLMRALSRKVSRVAVRSPAGQAGFFFTIQTLTRSASHRVTLAASVAVAFSIALITIGALNLDRTFTPATAPLSLFAMQTLIMAVLLTAFRHLVRIPADSRASWAFQMAWAGDQRRYVAGSKRAALALLVMPSLLTMLAVDGFLFPAIAVAHVIVGATVALLLMSALFFTYRRLPFATGYAGAGDLKAVAPLVSSAIAIAAVVVAAFERAALESLGAELAFTATLIAVLVGVEFIGARRRARPTLLEFDELPSDATQRLELTL